MPAIDRWVICQAAANYERSARAPEDPRVGAPRDTRRADRSAKPSASIGIAYGQHTNAEQLLADADAALYAAKTAGKNRYVVFEPEIQTASQDRLALELDRAR
jgi:predicted signal transduction protein with EAL and GGDEF domain